ncbi:TPA: hypothetical protein ACH3X1_015236 [Trebouxia sp. C0004]
MMVSRQLVESQAYIHEEHELVNRFVSKLFPGYPASFDGKIIHYNASLCPDFPFHVKYNDGDEEDITEAEARQIVNAGYHGASRHHSQDLVSNNSRPLAEGCNSAGDGYSASAHSDMHCLRKAAVGESHTVHASVAQLGKVTVHSRGNMAQSKQPLVAGTGDVHAPPLGRNNAEKFVGRATKLTTPNGPPGQITLVRSPNGVKRTTVQLTEPQQQHLQQQRQHQHQHQQQRVPQQVQQQQQPLTQSEQQQHTMKGQRSHRVRKTKVPALPTVIADPVDVAREVDNAVDNSDNQKSDVSHRGNNNAAGQLKSSKGAGHAASAAEDYAASESGEPNSPEHISRNKSLNPFMAAKLADAVGKGTSDGKAKKRQRQDSDDEESRCTLSDTEMTNGGDEGSNAPSRSTGRGRGRGGRGGRGATEAGSGRGGRGSRGRGGRGGQDRKALPMVPGQKKKRGRPSKQDIAQRQAYQAALEAAEARAAEEAAAEEAAEAAAAQQGADTPVGKQRQGGQPAAKATALPVPTADLDPPAQHSNSVSPAAGAKSAAGKPVGKQQSKQPVAGAVGNGKGNKPVPSSPRGRSLSPKGRTLSPTGRPQQKAAAAVPSLASPVHDANDGSDQQRHIQSLPLEQVFKSTEPVTTKPATGNDGQGLKRLKKQPPASKQQTTLAGQLAQQEFGFEDDVPAPHSVAEPKHVEILVTADAMDVDIDEPGCARSRPWTKHQPDAQAGDLVADQAMESADPPAVLPAAVAADPSSPTAVAKLPTDIIEQTGSGGAGHATAAPPDHDLPHQPFNASRGDAGAAAAAQQHDDKDRRNMQHQPRTSRTSPATHLPQKAATAQQQQAQTGNSQAGTGNSQPRGRRPGATGANGSPASDRHTEDSSQHAIPAAASEEERRSEDSSGNATAVQHGVGHTGESLEAVPVSMRSSKPARGQQQQHNRPTSSVSEQGLNSAAGNKSHLPGGTSGNNMAIVAAEAPESSSHTGRQGALVVQPQSNSACPSWFSGFMQLHQSANQNLDDKLTTMASKQDTTLAVVQGMQVSTTASASTACASTHVAVIGATGSPCKSVV